MIVSAKVLTPTDRLRNAHRRYHPLRHATILATFILYVAGMADDEVRAYGSVAPLKVGLLNDYPTKGGTDNDTARRAADGFRRSRRRGHIDRPVELVQRDVIGLPNGTYKAVERAFDELVAEGSWSSSGPYVSDNAVPLARTSTTAEVPIIILSGSEGALGEWCFALNNGSMPEEPGDAGRGYDRRRPSRIAIAYEVIADRQGVSAFAVKGYAAAGFEGRHYRRDSSGGSRQVRRGDGAAGTRARRAGHVGFGHGLWGFTDALAGRGLGSTALHHHRLRDGPHQRRVDAAPARLDRAGQL